MKKVMITFLLVAGLGFFGFIPQGNAQMGHGGYGMMGPAQTGPEGSGQWNYCPYCGRPLPRGGYGSGYGMGPGMMGRGGYGMMGPGMMGRGGYGMMGPGMMGRGYGMGSGMMGPQYGPGYQGPQYQKPQKPMEEEDAKDLLENYLQSTRNPNLKLGKIEDKGKSFEAEIQTKDGSLVDKIIVDKRTGWMRSAY